MASSCASCAVVRRLVWLVSATNLATAARIRVCTAGSGDLCPLHGPNALAAIRFLGPPDVDAQPTSCLARCERGTVVQVEAECAAQVPRSLGSTDNLGARPRSRGSATLDLGVVVDTNRPPPIHDMPPPPLAPPVDGEAATRAGVAPTPARDYFECVNDARRAASLLRSLGHSVDPRLVTAFSAALRADELVAAGRPADALNGYNRAFGLAAASGLGVRWRSRPSSVLRVRQAQAAASTSAALTPRRGRPLSTATPTQVRWLSMLMVSRSRTFSKLAATAGVQRGLRRSLEDAQYAVQLAECAALLEEPRGSTATRGGGEAAAAEAAAVAEASAEAIGTCAAAWERLAETYEAARDIEGAIAAYEQLLRLEPPFSPRLSPALSAKRGVQELVLMSHRRGVEDAVRTGQSIQQVAELGVESLQAKALADVEGLRRLVNTDFDTAERWIASRSSGGRSPSRFVRRATADLRKMRKVATSDINALELQIMRGDPTVSLARWAITSARRGGWRRDDGAAAVDSRAMQGSEEGLWLREQFDKGALPRDPVLVRSLLDRAKRDPELVARLITQAKDGKGLDMYERVANDANKFL